MRTSKRLSVTIAALALAAGPASAVFGDIATFYFAPVGNSFSAFLPADDPLAGKEIISARIYLDVESFPGSDAANFFTDITFPIQPFDGNDSTFVLFGSDVGWSGSGVFNYFEETTRFNGVFIPRRYGGETPGKDFDGVILKGSRIEFEVLPEPSSLLLAGLAGLLLAGRRTLRS